MKCEICNKTIVGRVDKIFCSVGCKNEYHVKLRQVNQSATRKIDLILHHNRSILLETLGKNGIQKKIDRLVLDRKKSILIIVLGFTLIQKGKPIIMSMILLGWSLAIMRF